MENWRLFWAKTNREKVKDLPEDWTHPLWAHLLDVGSTALLLWQQYLPASLKKMMVESIGMDEEATGRFLSIWIGLHDLGKAIPNFQGMHPPSKENLERNGLMFHSAPNRLHHGHASIAIVFCWLRSKGLEHDTLLDAAAACVGIHHGKLCQSCVWEEVAEDTRPQAVLGDTSWRTAQQALAEQVFEVWGAAWPHLESLPILSFTNPWPDWLMAFAGWATLSDWLGSMQTCFDPSVQPTDSLKEYLQKSKAGAEKAFQTAGLNQQARLRALSFQEHFKYDPRPLQEIVCQMPLHEHDTELIIVEAPTGEGKTEAAFYIAARKGGGVYVAMPSQSTSDGLFPRFRTFIQGDPDEGLSAAHQGPTAAVRLVHGNDLLHDDALSLLKVSQATASISDEDQPKQDDASKGRALSWFMPKKRALLVPYGVGTVDQLFLGVLHAKHFFLRLFALCGKTVIFDEVHAYDAYMNAIFDRLLHWLRALDINVVVLSATLPAETRRQMLQAWGGKQSVTSSEPAAYPVLWYAAEHKVHSYPFAPTPGREQRLMFQWCDADPKTIASRAEQYIQDGATVVVICNTVQRAQEVFQWLDRDDLLPEKDRMLLHARMPQAWRQQREKKARKRFGKDRPARPALLVGTQVIEQSLDIDADVMITDLAPIDLLLQRAGRLHRHDRKGRRPKGYEQPTFIIACSQAAEGDLPDVDSFSGGGKIYAKVLLWKTWSVLHQVAGWHLPLGSAGLDNRFLPGYRALIEAGYGDLSERSDRLSQEAKAEYEQAYDWWCDESNRHKNNAGRRLVPDTENLEALFKHKKSELKDEEETKGDEVPKYLQAFTRNPDSISTEVILLYSKDNGWSLSANDPVILPRNDAKYLTPNQLRKLFGAAVRIGHAGIVSTLWKEENEAWKGQQEKHAILKRFHLIELKDNQANVGKTQLILHPRLGITYENL